MFNGSQINGFSEEFEKAEFAVEKNVMAFFENTDISYFYGATLAGYDTQNDVVLMPNKKDFKTKSGFVSTLSHDKKRAYPNEHAL